MKTDGGTHVFEVALLDSASVCYEKRIVLISEGVILLVDLHNSSYHIPSRLIIIVDCYYCIGMPRFLKTELAKKSTYSTTYQLQTINDHSKAN